ADICAPGSGPKTRIAPSHSGAPTGFPREDEPRTRVLNSSRERCQGFDEGLVSLRTATARSRADRKSPPSASSHQKLAFVSALSKGSAFRCSERVAKAGSTHSRSHGPPAMALMPSRLGAALFRRGGRGGGRPGRG